MDLDTCCLMRLLEFISTTIPKYFSRSGKTLKSLWLTSTSPPSLKSLFPNKSIFSNSKISPHPLIRKLSCSLISKSTLTARKQGQRCLWTKEISTRLSWIKMVQRWKFYKLMKNKTSTHNWRCQSSPTKYRNLKLLRRQRYTLISTLDLTKHFYSKFLTLKCSCFCQMAQNWS